MVGELVGARLIAHAGSLMNLAKQPASTVQILGAEKASTFAPFSLSRRRRLVGVLLGRYSLYAWLCFPTQSILQNQTRLCALFRALKAKHDTPKYGLIYHASLVGQAQPKHKARRIPVKRARSCLPLAGVWNMWSSVSHEGTASIQAIQVSYFANMSSTNTFDIPSGQIGLLPCHVAHATHFAIGSLLPQGKISRVLAAKCALSIRVDALGESSGATIGYDGRTTVRPACSDARARARNPTRTSGVLAFAHAYTRTCWPPHTRN
eukprot:4042353-Pleurochrysis_carterae.AAC.1